MDYKIIKKHLTDRGGIIVIDLTPFGFQGHTMTAYQNYLGGGMLGKVCSKSTVDSSIPIKEIHLGLRKYLHNQTNPDLDSWEYMSFDNNQKLPASAIE